MVYKNTKPMVYKYLVWADQENTTNVVNNRM